MEVTLDKATRCLKLWALKDPGAYSIICFFNLGDQGKIKKITKKKVPSHIMGKGWRKKLSNYQSHPDYGHPFHIKWFSAGLRITQSQAANRQSPTKLYLDSDCFCPPQVTQKALVHVIFCGCVQFTLCFSISAKDYTNVSLFDSRSALRPIVRIGSDFLSRHGNITIRHFLTLFFSSRHLSADASIADIKMGEKLPKESVCQSFLIIRLKWRIATILI